MLLAGGGLGNAALFSIAKALRENGNKVIYFAGYKKGEDLYKREEIEVATDQVIESHGVKLLVDPISARYLTGAEVDFVDNITGGGFTIKNPNAKSTCGCGSSFSV